MSGPKWTAVSRKAWQKGKEQEPSTVLAKYAGQENADTALKTDN